MTCGCNDKCELPKALQINNPGEVTLFHRVDIPASQGDDTTYPPKNGLYRNVLLVYLANNHSYLYNSDGIPTRVDGPAGPGTAAGGETGQVLAKRSDADYDTTWVTQTSANDAKLTLTRNNTEIGDFTANASVDKTIDIEVPTKTSDLENDGATGESTYVEATALADYYTKDETDAAIGLETTAREGADQNLQQQIDAITVASDVVDVVGTYADLQAYDTSKLSDNDIIKVLADESKNGATTYYRWIKNSSSWTYIGSEGPYYTKSESDSTFQGKLTAGANITIDANNEISATDTTYTAGEGVEINNNTIAAKVRRVYDYYTSRPASANLTQTGNGGMFTFQATGSMTTGKPKDDAHILHMEWDNTGGWDSQIALRNNSDGMFLGMRAQNNGVWGSWVYTLLDTAGSVKTTNIDALAVTTAKIADGAITEAKINATDWAKKVNVAGDDLTGQTADLLTLTQALGTAGTDYARWICKYDGATANISNKPVAESFVCEAFCTRWTSSSDYRYQLMMRVKADTNPYVAHVDNSSASITWERLRPTVNDATLTVTQNGTSAGTFTANSATDTTIALTDTTYSDFTGATSSVAGAHGLVPAPTTSDPDKFLKGDGTWGTPPGTTYTEGTGIDITGSTIAVDTTQVSMKSDYTVKKSYTIDLTAQSTSNFYPVIFPRTQNVVDCEIHSEGGGAALAYNQNVLHFQMVSQGWSDLSVRKRLIILQEGAYASNEITIGCVGLGDHQGYNCVWLRGGIKYFFTCNVTAEAHTSTYTINDETFSVGTNYYGGTNANVTIYYTPQNVSKDVALMEDINALTVTTAKIADGAVTAIKIASGALAYSTFEGLSGGTSGYWKKLGNVTFAQHQQGKSVLLKILLGLGNNSNDHQQAFIDLVGQLAWTGVNNGRAGWTAEFNRMNNESSTSIFDIKVIANSVTSYDVYIRTASGYTSVTPIFVPGLHSDGTENAVWTPDYSAWTATAPSGTECAIAKVSVAMTSDLPTVNDATLTITQNGSTLGTFTANASSNVTIDVPGGGGAGAPTGAITMFAGSSAPTGYLLCDGSAVSRTTYADLFAVIGTAYGTGDGSTTFNLPNLKGKVPVGRDASDTSFDALGETGGEKTHKLTVAEMPKHQHRISCQKGTPGNSSWDYGQPGGGWSAQAWNPNPTEPIGGNGAHNNLQPYIVLNYIIKY